ncbi:translocation and assembly module lipoprotein TamL [Hyunsoonleella ulvae]|uniref:translocation and assembly module lipoprotein TamL n=1 Tax=Hyunsoonleella ulvae TaxID=2799948 RepID=UPI00293D7F15|nr:BamA/TamA family outer membrane protein [Hyunsoonleella ulvae]
MYLRQHSIKILSSVVLFSCFTSCNIVKRVAEDEYLLTKNTIVVDGKKNTSETLNNLLNQKPNSKVPLRLGIYNLARPNIDSILAVKIADSSNTGLKRFLSHKQYYKMQESKLHFNQWLKKTGEAPVILNEDKTKKSVTRLQEYYINNGWFNVSGNYNIERGDNKRAEVTYNIEKGPAFIIDSISENIASPAVETLYPRFRKNALVKKGEQYKTINFELERERISGLLRNYGLFHFKQDYITVEIDTIGTNNKVNVNFNIQNRAIRTPDSIIRKPFKIFKVKDVNVYTDHTFANNGMPIKDSITHNGFKLYSYGDMRFKPKAITDAIFISPNALFKDIDRTYTYRHLNELRTFKYPDIEYVEENDTTLTANIYLTPLKKFSLGFSTEASTSNIQRVGLALNPSLTIRNIFKGAETFEISGTAAIGSSVEPNRQVGDPFFDINELALDLRLTIPRLFSPFNTEKIIPKYMSPSTRITLSGSGQTNIGLDKQALSGVFSYNWRPNTRVTNQLDLFNIQYVRNLNIDNYFDIYTTSFRRLNSIAQSINYTNGEELSKPDGAEMFISDVLSNNTSLSPNDEDFRRVSAIDERKDRLTEDNLILSTSFNFIKDNRTSLLDEDFSIFRFRIESAGTLLANASRLLGLNKDADDRFNIFDVAFSQYIKTEFDYVKRWDLGKQNIFAIRSFFGIAIPYGNSDNIPFAKSFFGGGANDNRAWTAYALGPGSSESTDEFNEANLKIALSAEQRFNLFGDLNGALFVDAGNIWNVLDDVNDPRATFSGLNSLEDIAVGSGFGLRYDFSFFLFRFDVGFKTYDPSYRDANRWFNDYNFKNAVYNIGINYPF